MSVRKENYLIYGCKFGEEFTNEFWEQDFRDEMEWDEDKPNDKPYFITDGMNGNYTFFGFICQLSDGGDDDYEAKEINFQYDGEAIREKLLELYPDMELPINKLWYLPHYV
jgi:hypothetical protein